MSLISRRKDMNPFYQRFEFYCPICKVKVDKDHKCNPAVERELEKKRRKTKLEYDNEFFRQRNR
jgi:uncharacterized Zn finger protein (UPF0148 family)